MVSKASAGAMEALPVYGSDDLPDLLKVSPPSILTCNNIHPVTSSRTLLFQYTAERPPFATLWFCWVSFQKAVMCCVYSRGQCCTIIAVQYFSTLFLCSVDDSSGSVLDALFILCNKELHVKLHVRFLD